MDAVKFNAVVKTPFGALGIRVNSAQTHIQEFIYLPAEVQSQNADCELAALASEQVQRFIDEPAFKFELPLLHQGTEFQNKVWRVIASLDAGQVLTYKQVGQIISCGAPRAVGGACGANPYPLIVPCHRVVASNGIGGFARNDGGFYVGIKRWLLAREGIIMRLERGLST